ncbi:signal transduction histidine kinase [Bacillus sp. SORGH_AS 510]|uniref:sensor histidine kinase n=1 Tax=Bacillus sp. SORGH_AS_0510 TaxID=3041771 RepID=UPI00277D960E|nr:HAMP domain-containing sensor histidine kinase [Bacillus sp. SORGH_AS_0510]MDQ1144129.1 signal transduction histidine kinase [Bacillus sp. SORGH_AS_0510]
MKSLYGKFVLTTVLIMLFSTICGFFLTNTYYQSVMKERNDKKNVKIAESIVSHIENSPQLDLSDYLSTVGKIGYQLYVVDESGHEQFFGGKYRVKDLNPSFVKNVLSGHIYHGMRDFPRQTFVTGFFANELSNTIGVPFTFQNTKYALFVRPDIKLLFSEVHTILGGLILGTALLSLLLMLVVAKFLIVPITQLTEATKQIAKENYDTQLNIERRDEIGQLAASFHTMVEQLQENDRMRKEFISNVSHDFQSPLLNIQGYAGLLKSTDLSDQDRVNYADIIQSETKRLSKLTRQLLLLTSLDQSTRMLNYQDFRLDEQVKDCVNKYRWRLEEKQLNLLMELEPTTYHGDEALLENVWDNLLSNAIKYNRTEGEIQIRLHANEAFVEVTVSDTGIGLAQADKAQIFERFFRADRSRTEEGTGLGLSIVKQIVELHHGEVHVTSAPNEGTTFSIRLPYL